MVLSEQGKSISHTGRTCVANKANDQGRTSRSEKFLMGEKISMGMGRPLPQPLPDPEDYVVDFDGIDDPSHPYNWKFTTK